MSEFFTCSDGTMLPDTRPGPCPRPKTSWSTCFLWFMARSCWCPCVYMWMNIYTYIYIIHTQHNHTHAYIEYYIHIYCKSCVLKQFGDVKIIVTSKPKTIYCAGQHGVPLWWKWPTLGTFLKKLISGEMSHISLISLKELRNKIIRRKTTSSENIWEPVG